MSTSAAVKTAAEDRLEVEELRERIQDIVLVDANFQDAYYLYFWLKVRNFNVDKTEAFIREVKKWRKENKAEQAAKLDYQPEISNRFKVFEDGRTRSGMLVWTANSGQFKFRNTIAKYGKDAVHNYWLQLLAKCEKRVIDLTHEVLRTRKDTKNVSTWPLAQKNWVLLNMAGLGYGEMLCRDVLSSFLDIARMAVCYFPSIEGTLCFVNAGKVLEIFFSLLKPLLRGTNVNLVIFDYNEEKWKRYVHKYIDPSQIRCSFGGTRPDDL